MNINETHLIKSDINAIFHYPTLTLIEVNDLVFNILAKLKNNESFESIAIETKLNTNDIETLIANLSKTIPNNKHQEEEKEAVNKRKSIGRITLHIANGCNLRCKYCYANGGNYNQPENMMTLETASKFVDFCTTHFDKIGSIVFFGGEPLLNPKIIQYICESFEHLYKENKIDYLPVWTLITNGTLLNNDILGLIKRYIKVITVSIDGPQNLNDFNRIFVNGKGSYNKIADFIKTIKRETDVHLKYEATYTSYHHQNNWSESDVKSFLKKEFNIKGTVASDINWQENLPIPSKDVTSFPEGFFGILNSMAHKIYKEMCPVGNNIIAISTEGEIYPCHMNCGKKHLSLGSINSDNIFNSQNKYLSRFPYLKSIFKTEKPCTDCWANPICGGCTMRWFFNTKTNEYDAQPSKSLCETNKKHIETILLLIIRMRKDKIKWAELLNGLEKYDDYDSFTLK